MKLSTLAGWFLLASSSLPARPEILATLVFPMEDPAILHLLGEGFGGPGAPIEVGWGGVPCSFTVLNDAHLVLIRPDPAAPGRPRTVTVTVTVHGQTCAYPLDLLPLRVPWAPGERLLPEDLDPLAPRYNRSLRTAFALPPAPIARDGQEARGQPAHGKASAAAAAAGHNHPSWPRPSGGPQAPERSDPPAHLEGKGHPAQ